MAHDWKKSDRRLHDVATATIEMFATEHPSVEVCAFFFDCDDPQYGHISIAFDSLQNNIRSAKTLEQFAIENRNDNLQGELTWQWAKYQLSTPVLSPFNTNSGDFQFPRYQEIEFPAWRKLAKSKDYPSGETTDDDYLESNARLVMWRVAEQLIAKNAFTALTLASPFMVGYSVHDQEESILRLLNWPKNA